MRHELNRETDTYRCFSVLEILAEAVGFEPTYHRLTGDFITNYDTLQ